MKGYPGDLLISWGGGGQTLLTLLLNVSLGLLFNYRYSYNLS